MIKRTEILLVLTLLFHLQGFFGNLYEEVLTPNSIAATIEQINAYNSFPSITKPYYYYIPFTQIGVLLVFYLAVFGDLPAKQQKLVRYAAVISGLTTALTVYVVTQYNLKMFFGDVTHLGERIHQLHLEWAILNGIRVIMSGIAIFFLFKAYRNAIKGDLSETKTPSNNLMETRAK